MRQQCFSVSKNWWLELLAYVQYVLNETSGGKAGELLLGGPASLDVTDIKDVPAGKAIEAEQLQLFIFLFSK